MASTLTDLNPYYDIGSHNRAFCLLLTGNNRQKSLNLLYLQKLIFRFIPLLSRINAKEMVDFCAAREEFSLTKFEPQYQAKTGKINRQITGISGKSWPLELL